MVCPQIDATAIAGKQPEPPAAAFTALAIQSLPPAQFAQAERVLAAFSGIASASN